MYLTLGGGGALISRFKIDADSLDIFGLSAILSIFFENEGGGGEGVLRTLNMIFFNGKV